MLTLIYMHVHVFVCTCGSVYFEMWRNFLKKRAPAPAAPTQGTADAAQVHVQACPPLQGNADVPGPEGQMHFGLGFRV